MTDDPIQADVEAYRAGCVQRRDAELARRAEVLAARAAEGREHEDMNTRVVYMYRDGSNYKQYDTVVFDGEITAVELAVLVANTLQTDDYESYTGSFLPEQVGLSHLVELWGNAYEDDHPWHEMQEVELTPWQATTERSIHDFVAQFDGIVWDESAAGETVDAFIAAHPRTEEDE